MRVTTSINLLARTLVTMPVSLVGGNVEKIVYRSPIDFQSTSSDTVFDFASGSGRINLAAFGALAWLHMTAATKSIPPHTLAWVYDSASNETIVYVNATDRILDIGDRGLLEIHLEGIVSVAEADVRLRARWRGCRDHPGAARSRADIGDRNR